MLKAIQQNSGLFRVFEDTKHIGSIVLSTSGEWIYMEDGIIITKHPDLEVVADAINAKVIFND